MLQLCIEKDRKEIYKYIGKEYYKCLYLFLNIEKYGFNNPNVKIYMYRNGNEIEAVMLLYYTSLSIFSRWIKINFEIISKFINELKPTVIQAEKNIIINLYPYINDLNYDFEYGYVRKAKKSIYLSHNDCERVEKQEDFLEISGLLCGDEDVGSYSDIKKLAKQLEERNLQKFGRNYIIKINNKIIAHCGTGAENKKIAVLNYLMVHPQYRRQGYAYKIASTVCNDLMDDGKEIFLINYTKESSCLYNKMNFEVCCEWGKCFSKLKN